MLKNSADTATALPFDTVQASVSVGCSFLLMASGGDLDDVLRFWGVFGEFFEILGGGGEQKFIIGPSGAAQP